MVVKKVTETCPICGKSFTMRANLIPFAMERHKIACGKKHNIEAVEKPKDPEPQPEPKQEKKEEVPDEPEEDTIIVEDNEEEPDVPEAEDQEENTYYCCENCGEMVEYQAEICPSCGEALSWEGL
jgi:RNA polymerase subunit RPABC4/transcription elongation factor Spt4